MNNLEKLVEQLQTVELIRLNRQAHKTNVELKQFLNTHVKPIIDECNTVNEFTSMQRHIRLRTGLDGTDIPTCVNTFFAIEFERFINRI